MDACFPQINKITPPRLHRLIHRQRLFKELDQSSQASAVWLSGPGGSGKTSLIASYLDVRKIPFLWYQIDTRDNDPATFFYYFSLATVPLMDSKAPALPLFGPEYLLSYETFAMHFLEKFCAQVRHPVWIVFDNFQEIPTNYRLLQLLSRMIEGLPPNIVVVIVSRNTLPVEMARLRANRTLQCIDADKLVFARDECRELSDLLDVKLSDDEIAQLCRLTCGWCAGLVLWLMYLKLNPGARPLTNAGIPDSIFDYFAGEILAKTDARTRCFLLQSALLPYMTVESTGQFTKIAAKEILDQLHRQNFFLEKRQLQTLTYQFHPLFHKFLKDRLFHESETEKIHDLQCRGAAILTQTGMIEDAVALYQNAKAYLPLSDLILTHAPQLFAQGRFRTLAEWIAILPEKLITQNPWLLYWKSMTVMLDRPPQGQTICIESFNGFKNAEDLIGQFVSWSSIVESYIIMRGIFTDLDFWIAEGERLGKLLSPDLDFNITAHFMESMLGALMLRNLAHPEFYDWQKRCEDLVSQVDDQQALAGFGYKLIWSYHWMGQVYKARTLIKRLQSTQMFESSSPLSQCTFRTAIATMYVAEGLVEECQHELDETLSLVRKSGIHVFDFLIFVQGVYSAMLVGDLDKVHSYLRRMEKVLMPHAHWDLAHYHFLLAASHLMTDNWDEAEVHINTSCKLAAESGTPFPEAFTTIQQAHYLLERGRLDQAQKALGRIADMAVPQHYGYIYFLRELVLADCAMVQQQNAVMQTHLQAAFSCATENGLQMPFGLLRSRLAVLCSEALKADIHPPIVTRLISRMRLLPPKDGRADEKWPWLLHCFSFGCLRVICNNRPLKFTTKTPKKLLELLKLLICRHNNKSSREALAYLLWPDADGDRALQNINTTLHRLRKLLGGDKAILQEQGYLFLNPDVCWVDTWYFESLVILARAETDQIKRSELLFKALEIYKGHFGNIDDDSPWVIGYANRLRSLWIDTVITLDKLLSENGKYKESEEMLQKALLIDNNAAEPISQSLITVLHCVKQDC